MAGTAFMDPTLLLAFAAVAAAGAGGACLGGSWARRRAASERLTRMRRAAGAVREGAGGSGAVPRPAAYACEMSHRLALGATAPLARGLGTRRAGRWLDVHARRAGLAGSVSPEGFAEAAVRLALAAAGLAALGGAVLSTELAAVGASSGALWGATAPARAVRRLERERAAQLGRDLSEMLEVTALGLRSGLSFDRSFQLYGAHFGSAFAQACDAAQRSWSCGLTTREAALRDLAASYDSPLLARVVENVVRSLRFGSSLAESLEAAGAEARAVHRAQVEERVAKAPVKMMVPTGTLILPAMLLLVLGPVLLELMEGF